MDVGGTFTDLVVFCENTGEIRNFKVPSVPRNPEKGVINAFDFFLEEFDAASIKTVGHATTIATNVFFGQIDLELPKIAFITTKGFRDIVEIGRQRRSEVYNLFFVRPPSLIERRQRYEVEERVSSKGEIIKPLNIADVNEALTKIIDEGVNSLAIGFLNSYSNPVHEEKVLKLAKQKYQELYLTASSRISDGYREYERFSTAVVNATLLPIVNEYISKLVVEFEKLKISSQLFIMQSNGGVATSEIVSEKPSTIVESGPASGVIAASWLGGLTCEQHVISFDMGGTTAKAGAIRAQIPEVVQEYEVAGKVHLGRLMKGSGYTVRFPFIDLAECSAGGGTIAWADKGGSLRVGPKSAGAIPGPACYNKGGKSSTVTDANLTLGRLNPSGLLNGNMKIFPQIARFALKDLGDILGLDVEAVASSVIQIVNSIMSKILRIVSIERGFDPRAFTLIAFGGAGPMHACALAEELDIRKIIIPRSPGMFSAVGLLVADLFHDFSHAYVRSFEDVDLTVVESLFLEMEKTGKETLLGEGVKENEITFLRQADIRYVGQSYELTIKVNTPFNGIALRKCASDFHVRHSEIYGYASSHEPIEMVNLRLRAIGKTSKPFLKESKDKRNYYSPINFRPVYFEGLGERVETPIYDRRSIDTGFKLEGPAIFEQYDSTTVVYPLWNINVDRYGNIIIRR